MGTTVSVIIPYLEENDIIRKTLASICDAHHFDVTEIEVLVVDSTNGGSSRRVIDGLSICKIISSPNIKTVPQAYMLGLEQAKGSFITFMHCGDTVSNDYFATCTQALQINPIVPFVVAKSFCINPTFPKKKENKLNIERFDKNSIIDIRIRPELIQLSVTEALFRAEIFSQFTFNCELKYESEQGFMLQLLKAKPQYATVADPEYNYFMPKEDDFLYYLPANYKDWYTKSFKEFILPLMDNTCDSKGTVPNFVQFYIIFAVQARFLSNLNNRNKKNMDHQELSEFFDVVSEALKRIDDIYILNKNKYKQLSYSDEAAKMLMQVKYDLSKALPLSYVQAKEDAYLNYEDVFITKMSSQRAAMHVIDFFDGKLSIDGSFREVFDTDFFDLFAVLNGKTYPLKNNDRYSLTKYFGISAYKKFTFHLDFELDETKSAQTIAFFARIGQTIVPLKLSFIHHWSKFCITPKNSYWRFNRYIAHLENDSEIVIEQATAKKTFISEMKFLPQVLRHSRRGFITRIMYWLTRPYFKNKKIWLMYDKMYKGGDSCEYLYRYTKDFNDGVTRYYIIDGNTYDYRHMKKDGLHPVKNRSWKHRLAFLNADIVLITNSNVFPFNGYNMDKSRFIRGLCNFPSMCLQHGLSVQKCAMAQQRIVDNTRMYFLGSHHEVTNLSNHAYNYKNMNILKLTGIGRYDGLVNKDQKQILLSPTWRMYNAMPVTTSEGEQRTYNPEFKHSTYYKIYNDLINNQKLIETAKRNGYKIKYLLHPILSSQVTDFVPDPYVEVIPSVGTLSYEDILTKSSLMVTDYSGVQFDFAYMKKPLVYFHPSQLPAHYEDGCFFYETMGFGEICTEGEQLVDLLCDYMENGCVMKPQYVERVDEFYEHSDHNNCERIYKEIMNYQQIVDRDKLKS